MPYIGNQPAEQFTSFATQTFSVSATTSYTLDHAVTNENEIALFVNNVRQQPGSGKAYTASSTTLTLSAATASTDTMYCVFLGRALQTVTPATNSITAAMVGNDLISGKDALGATPADTDEFLVSDAGTLKRVDFSHIKGGNLLEADQFRLSASIAAGTNADITSNLERIDTTGSPKVGTGMSESSGIFTFPSTGMYLVTVHCVFSSDANDAMHYVNTLYTANNSSYVDGAYAVAANKSGSAENQSGCSSIMIDVTDTSNVKVKFATVSMGSGTALSGNTDVNYTTFTFLRLGDT
jgi:hypothetical protein